MEIFNAEAKLPELELITSLKNNNNSISSSKLSDDILISSAMNTKERISYSEISEVTTEERRQRSREDIGKWIDDFSELSIHSASTTTSPAALAAVTPDPLVDRYPSSTVSKLTDDSVMMKDGLEMIPENPIENEFLPNLSIMKPTQHLLEQANMTKNTKSSGKGVETVVMDVPSSITSESSTSAYINDQTGKTKFSNDPELLEESIPQVIKFYNLSKYLK